MGGIIPLCGKPDKKIHGRLIVQAYGACHPTPCEWGWVYATGHGNNVSDTYPKAFSANYNPGVAKKILTGIRQPNNRMAVLNFTQFTDGSNRSNFYPVEYSQRISLGW